MSTAFANTLRTLQNDTQRISLGWIVLISLLLLGWLSWFLFAPLTQAVEGAIVQADGDGIVWAQFPATAARRLQIGQPALIRRAADMQAQPIPATVSAIGAEGGDQLTQVEFYVDLDAPAARAFQRAITGTVGVIVEEISPAIQVWRTTGQFIDTPPVQVQ